MNSTKIRSAIRTVDNVKREGSYNGYRYIVIKRDIENITETMIPEVIRSRWCGYVNIPHNHILYGVHYDEEQRVLNNKSIEEYIEAPGGITYSGAMGPFKHCIGFTDRNPAMNEMLMAEECKRVIDQLKNIKLRF